MWTTESKQQPNWNPETDFNEGNVQKKFYFASENTLYTLLRIDQMEEDEKEGGKERSKRIDLKRWTNTPSVREEAEKKKRKENETNCVWRKTWKTF